MQFIKCILLLIIPSFALTQISFEAVTDAQSILQGSSFQISFQIKNGEASAFNAPDFAPFQVLSGPSRSMQTSIINGVMSSSVSYIYVLGTNRIGTFTIPPATAVINGKTFRTKSVTIQIVKADANMNASEDVFIKAIPDKLENYVGEQLVLTYKLYTRVSINNIEFASKPILDNFQEEAININNNTAVREIYNGKEYTTKVLTRTALYPLKPGKIKIEPAIFRIMKGENDPWGMSMPSLFRQQIENISSNEVEILVKPLPEPVPANFSGAVGEMFVQINPLNKSYTLNDAIHLSVQIRGDANFNLIKPDFIQLDTNFEISDSRTGELIKVTEEPRLIRTKKFDFLIIPKLGGNFTIKPGFVYFNTLENKYVNLSDSFTIQVNASLQTPANSPSQEFVDIQRELKYGNANPLFKDYRTWLLCCIPIIFLVLGLFGTQWKSFTGRSPDINTSTQTNDELQELEHLIIQKFNKNFASKAAVNNLATAKQVLTEYYADQESAKNFLHMIREFEALKYGFQSADIPLAGLTEKLRNL